MARATGPDVVVHVTAPEGPPRPSGGMAEGLGDGTSELSLAYGVDGSPDRLAGPLADRAGVVRVRPAGEGAMEWRWWREPAVDGDGTPW